MPVLPSTRDEVEKERAVSTVAKITTMKSNMLNLSLKYSYNPNPSSFIIISVKKMNENAMFIFSRV